MHNKTITQVISDLKNKEYSAYELTKYYVDRIGKYNSTLNTYITVTSEDALKQAKSIDENIAKNKFSSLMGIPIAHKDIFCTKGIKTTCGSKILENFISPYNATVVQKLSDAGTILLGKTNMDEFAMGSSNENSHFGPVKNPWDLECVPGGSSGGSASAVAAGLALGATGTDTGGSIRQPAALCGISGLKPTYGLLSRFGMISYASSLDQAGPLAKSAKDIALLMNHMAGYDPKDSTSVNKSTPNYLENIDNPIKGLKVGIIKELIEKLPNKDVVNATLAFVKELEKLGAIIYDDIKLPHSDLSVPTYYIIAPAECSSNLARFDGVRYGYRAENPTNLTELYEHTRSDGFGDEVKRRIMTGTYALSAGSYDDYYVKAQKIRQLICQDYSHAFQKVDVIICPTSPTPAFKLGEKTQNPVEMYLNDIFTIGVNLAGMAALSIPIGFSEGKPIGGQIIGNYFSEQLLLNIGNIYQKNTDWHTKKIPLENLKE